MEKDYTAPDVEKTSETFMKPETEEAEGKSGGKPVLIEEKMYLLHDMCEEMSRERSRSR